MQTFQEYQITKQMKNAKLKYTWDGEPLVEGTPEWMEAEAYLIEDEDIQEVQKGSISFLGLGFSILTGTWPLYLAYKMVKKSIEKGKAGCANEPTIIARNRCLADFRQKGYEAKIKLLSKMGSKTKDPKKLKTIDKQIAKQKKAISKIRADF